MTLKHNKQKIAWRKRNPKKRNAQRQRHYDKTKVMSDKTNRRPTGVPHRTWTGIEDALIILKESLCHGVYLSVTDRQLSRSLHRSVHAIQERRRKLKKEMK